MCEASPRIAEAPRDWRVSPNLLDYEAARATFSWAAARRELTDLDSMDFLNFVISLHEALGVDVPEVDYPKLATLDGCVGYLGEAPARRP
jgi:hypothetical protein